MKTFIAILICALSFELTVFAQVKSGGSAMNPEFAEVLTNPPPPGFPTRLDYVRSFTNQKDILNAYHKGVLNDGEALIALEALGDKNSMDIYGQVVDQNNQPVAGADALGDLEVSGDFFPHHAKTDAQGKFSFVGLHGANLFISFKKQGYDYNQRLLPERPKNYLPDPNNPLVFTMWKERGAESMIHDKEFYKISPDGKLFTIDFDNRQIIEGDKVTGDLQIKIHRPLQIKAHQHFNWSFDMTAIDGGLIEVTNATYLNEAPESGYQSSYELNMTTLDSGWEEQITKTFYLKSRGDKTHGHFRVTVIPNYNDVSVFKVDAYVNPSGSRNLEFDPKKQIH